MSAAMCVVQPAAMTAELPLLPGWLGALQDSGGAGQQRLQRTVWGVLFSVSDCPVIVWDCRTVAHRLAASQHIWGRGV